jgi:hypothetical protein
MPNTIARCRGAPAFARDDVRLSWDQHDVRLPGARPIPDPLIGDTQRPTPPGIPSVVHEDACGRWLSLTAGQVEFGPAGHRPAVVWDSAPQSRVPPSGV